MTHRATSEVWKKQEIYFWVIMGVIITTICLKTAYTKVKPIEVILITGVALVAAINTLIPIAKDRQKIKKLIDQQRSGDEQPTESNKTNNLLLLGLSVGFIVGMWYSFYSTDDSNDFQATTTKNQEIITVKVDTIKNVTVVFKDTVVDYIKTTKPQIEETLNLLKDVNTVAGQSLFKAKEIESILITTKALNDSITEEINAQSLYSLLGYIAENAKYDLSITEAIKRSPEDWQTSVTRFLYDYENKLLNQINNPFVRDNPSMLKELKSLQSKIRATIDKIAEDYKDTDVSQMDDFVSGRKLDIRRLVEVYGTTFHNYLGGECDTPTAVVMKRIKTKASLDTTPCR